MIQENELWSEIIRPLGDRKNAFDEIFSDEEVEELRTALTKFLVDAANDNTGIDVVAEDLGSGKALDLVLIQTGKVKKNCVLCFSFKDAAAETALPILGIALTLYYSGRGLAAIPQVAGALKTLWSKLILLKRPEDANAIDVLNALLRVRAEHVLSDDEQHPSTREIEINSGLAKDPVTAALKSLRARGVIDVVAWAGQADDMTQDGNRWKVRL